MRLLKILWLLALLPGLYSCAPMNGYISIIPIGERCNKDTCYKIYELRVE